MCVCACQAWFEPRSELLFPLIWGPNPSFHPSTRYHLPPCLPRSSPVVAFTGRGDTAGWFTMKTPVFRLIHMYTKTNGCLVTRTMRGLLCYFCNFYFEGIQNKIQSWLPLAWIYKIHFPPMWRHSQASLKKPSVCGGHFDVSPLLSLFCISFSHDSLCQALGCKRAASANAVTKGAGSEGGACEAFDVDD